MLSISTVWNAWRHRTAAGMVEEVRALGFSSLELSFGMPAELVDQIAGLVRAGQVSVSSLHNYCPAPVLPEGMKLSHSALPLSSLDERLRRWAVRQTVRTIETAAALKARAVVLHMGRVEIRPASPRLIALLENNQADSARFRKLSGKLRKRREAAKGPYLEAALRSLKELAGPAGEIGVRLGIENRYYPEEIPSLDEIGELIAAAASPAVGFWYDLGHAAVKGNLGWEDPGEYLKRYEKDLVGLHIHDVIRTRDHKAPLEGDLDYGPLGEIMKQDLCRVLEVHPSATPEEVKAAGVFLENLGRG
ncbi:MAG: sugar phosphate isomerase/epimerase [Candidatus Erginobacter occultus]|nr:sugar phosphate isomerase/epimerase [Candidatus Erginobacter occultus]